MKQLDFLHQINQDSSGLSKQHSKWSLYIDGASRNNPGPSGAGVYILKDGKPAHEYGFFLGVKTNNQAEYLALLLGLYVVKQRIQPGDTLHIISDSELMVKQMNGLYKVKNPDLKSLYLLAQKLLEQITVNISHVLRSENVHADRLANDGIDQRKAIPQEFRKILSNYEISL